jgi:hypothetical protein
MLAPSTPSPPKPVAVAKRARLCSSLPSSSQSSLSSADMYRRGSQPSTASSPVINHPRGNPQVEDYRRMLHLTSQLQRKQSARVRWKVLREKIQSLDGYCFLCSRDTALVYGHTALDCDQKFRLYSQGMYDLWLKYARNAFHSGQPLKSCLSCGMPESSYHSYNRKGGEIFNCPNKYNTLPLVYLIIHDPRYRLDIIKAFPQVRGSAKSMGHWLFADPAACGASGMVEILTWYFTNVFNK